MKRYLLILSIMLLSAMQVAGSSNYVYKNPTGDEFPILAWYSIVPDAEQTLERYTELREAGFNITFPHFGSITQVQKALDICEQTKVKLLVMCGELNYNTAATVNTLKDHKALAGWFIGDEPSMAQFPAYGSLAAAIRENDSEHFIYGNLLPIFAKQEQLGIADGQTYLDYVKGYAADVNTGLLSYDMYPIRETASKPTYIAETYYENVETVRKVSEETGQPFWGFCLATAHGNYPVPTLQHLRIQAFVNLLHGAQCIQYFTYWTPLGTQWDFHNAPIDENGNKTNVYYRVQEMNAEIQNQAWVFLGSKVESVGYLSGYNIPSGCTALPSYPSMVRSVSMSSGNGVLMSHLSRGTKHFFIVMNHQLTTKAVRIRLQEGVKRVLKTGEVTDAGTTVKENLEAGDYVTFYWEETPTGIKQLVDEELKFGASVGNGSIRVHGGEADVYNIKGEFVGRTSSVLPVPKGMYVVKHAKRTIKLKV